MKLDNYIVDEEDISDEQREQWRAAIKSGDFSAFAEDDNGRNFFMACVVVGCLLGCVLLVAWAIHRAMVGG